MFRDKLHCILNKEHILLEKVEYGMKIKTLIGGGSGFHTESSQWHTCPFSSGRDSIYIN